ncbi:uncharacterized protein BT62DRAFT_1081309 [Guyanagaster necrorhizus]|uniref:Uncharacterized protein n=1 Tax=Guyanagaster necrorhizus TaxID=856835 RepID=A0A9P7VGA8_9AGAR|nr:uncharacterized protein BT62DRAFT_1081309 [Guyanagaster necrorhizus MCA 3950]KAG7439860.1 hypothetical protein BT62DRAFT_1081309 [Guyanagaster necrorhizus MCA 3950]
MPSARLPSVFTQPNQLGGAQRLRVRPSAPPPGSSSPLPSSSRLYPISAFVGEGRNCNSPPHRKIRDSSTLGFGLAHRGFGRVRYRSRSVFSIQENIICRGRIPPFSVVSLIGSVSFPSLIGQLIPITSLARPSPPSSSYSHLPFVFPPPFQTLRLVLSPRGHGVNLLPCSPYPAEVSPPQAVGSVTAVGLVPPTPHTLSSFPRQKAKNGVLHLSFPACLLTSKVSHLTHITPHFLLAKTHLPGRISLPTSLASTFERSRSFISHPPQPHPWGSTTVHFVFPLRCATHPPAPPRFRFVIPPCASNPAPPLVSLATRDRPFIRMRTFLATVPIIRMVDERLFASGQTNEASRVEAFSGRKIGGFSVRGWRKVNDFSPNPLHHPDHTPNSKSPPLTPMRHLSAPRQTPHADPSIKINPCLLPPASGNIRCGI